MKATELEKHLYSRTLTVAAVPLNPNGSFALLPSRPPRPHARLAPRMAAVPHKPAMFEPHPQALPAPLRPACPAPRA